jgi:hypothetical protein
VSRGEGFTSPHLIRLAAVPLPALVNSERVGTGKAGSKNAKGKERRVCAVHPKEREENSEKGICTTRN